MTREVADFTVDVSSSLRDVMKRIDTTGLGIAFIVDGGELVGVATDGDVRRGIIEGVGMDESIEVVMNDNPIVLYDSWDQKRRREELKRHDAGSKIREHANLVVPVLDEREHVVDIEFVSDSGKLVGTMGERNGTVNTVLVVGGAGYIGSVLSRVLLDRGYEVKVLDNAVYGTHGIEELRGNERFTYVEGDMRSIETVTGAIRGVDAVVHLGALVGDPASGIDPRKTLEMNYHSTNMIASVCKYHQINRFVFASTCSVYGQSYDPETLLTEDSELNPVSLYAKTKIESERALLDLADGNFSPTIVRMATIYGLSPRMRFDLVVNVVNAKAHFEDAVPIFGGKQYRPNVHVRDAARAFADVLGAPIEDVGEVFNVGSNEQNYRIEEIGRIVADVYPDSEIDWHRDKEDDRSYQVDFSKIRSVLDFEPEETIESASLELKDTLESGQFEDYSDERYHNYKTLEGNKLFEG
jgi:nucleoside-diphosphate-sugar epimerase